MPARILVIEDDPGSRELAAMLLAHAGHQVLLANDGITGLAMALQERPDLVMCDLHMPIMGGYEVVKRLRAESGWRRVPLVALTASSMSGDREQALAAGFDHYLSKPITPETFVETVAGLLAE